MHIYYVHMSYMPLLCIESLDSPPHGNSRLLPTSSQSEEWRQPGSGTSSLSLSPSFSLLLFLLQHCTVSQFLRKALMPGDTLRQYIDTTFVHATDL